MYKKLELERHGHFVVYTVVREELEARGKELKEKDKKLEALKGNWATEKFNFGLLVCTLRGSLRVLLQGLQE